MEKGGRKSRERGKRESIWGGGGGGDWMLNQQTSLLLPWHPLC